MDVSMLHQGAPHLHVQLLRVFTTAERRRSGRSTASAELGFAAAALSARAARVWEKRERGQRRHLIKARGGGLGVRAKRLGRRGREERRGRGWTRARARVRPEMGMTGDPHVSVTAGEGRGTRGCAGPLLGWRWCGSSLRAQPRWEEMFYSLFLEIFSCAISR
jgi:hypothetical protein